MLKGLNNTWYVHRANAMQKKVGCKIQIQHIFTAAVIPQIAPPLATADVAAAAAAAAALLPLATKNDTPYHSARECDIRPAFISYSVVHTNGDYIAGQSALPTVSFVPPIQSSSSGPSIAPVEFVVPAARHSACDRSAQIGFKVTCVAMCGRY